jgi:hypothetical protein
MGIDDDNDSKKRQLKDTRNTRNKTKYQIYKKKMNTSWALVLVIGDDSSHEENMT